MKTSPSPIHLVMVALAVALVAVLVAAPAALAQQKPKGAAKQPSEPAAAAAAAAVAQGEPVGDAAPKVKVERGSGGKKIYRITGEILIEGKIQKPEAFYVLQKSSINYEWQELKQDFVPKILDSVNQAPF